MTAHTHTPGPWLRVDLEPDRGNLEQLVNSSGRAAMQISGAGGPEWHCNAALIAAAPALLDALRAVMGVWPYAREAQYLAADQQAIREQARAAIAQACGETGLAGGERA